MLRTYPDGHEKHRPLPHIDLEAKLSSEYTGRASLAKENDLITFQFGDYVVEVNCTSCLIGRQPHTKKGFATKIFLRIFYVNCFVITMAKTHDRNKLRDRRFTLAHGFRDFSHHGQDDEGRRDMWQWLFLKNKQGV